jgi:cytochrome oxidase Cu insertion factor (SCO1/SenC/PrrC family)
MEDRRFIRKTVWSIVSVLAFFTSGLGGGMLLYYVFAGKKEVTTPKLSEVIALSEKTEKFDPSSLPPIGLSSIPPEDQHSPGSTVGVTAHEGKPFKIPWADPYPAYPFTLIDQNGKEISLQDFLGKVVVISFIYTRCKEICPLLIEELKKLQEALKPLMGKEVIFLSITIDPRRDTSETLKWYGEEHGIDFRSWGFLTGSEEKVREVLEVYRVHVEVEEEPGNPKNNYELGHGNPIYFIDQWGQVRKRTAPTMLVQIGRPAIEYLVEQGTHDISEDEDLAQLRERRKQH